MDCNLGRFMVWGFGFAELSLGCFWPQVYEDLQVLLVPASFKGCTVRRFGVDVQDTHHSLHAQAAGAEVQPVKAWAAHRFQLSARGAV